MISRHFSEKLYQRFKIYSDETTESKLLTAIARKKVRFIRKDAVGVLFETSVLGPKMIVVVSFKGEFITCDLPSKVGRK